METHDGPFLSNMVTEIKVDPVNSCFKGNSIKFNPARGEKQGQRETFANIREAVLQKLQANISSRFPRVDLLHAMQVWLAFLLSLK